MTHMSVGLRVRRSKCQIAAQSSHRRGPSQMVCTSASRSPLVRPKKLPRQYLQRGTYGSSHVMRNVMKASWQGRNSLRMLLTCRRKFLMCRHSAKVSSDTGSPPKMRLSPPKFPAARRRSTVLPPFQPCVDEVPHAVLDGKLEQRMHSLHLDIKSATIARVQERLAVCR